MLNAPTILWFRKDLRLSDHPALQAAIAAGGPVIGVFIRDALVDQIGAAAKLRLDQSLSALADDMAAIGGRLIFRSGQAGAVLNALIDETQAKSVYWSRAYVPNEQARDAQIKSDLRDRGMNARSFGGFLLFEPWDVATKTGGFFKVYTPFWRAVCTRDVAQPLPAVTRWPAPDHWPASETLTDWDLRGAMRRGGDIVAAHQTPGANAAQARLDEFIDLKVNDYKAKRDIPALDVTSNLSDALALGEISPHTCWAAGQQAAMAGKQGAEHYLKELVWREFAYHLLHHSPHILTDNWRPDWAAFPWRTDANADDILRWKQGRTGYRFIDAAMRQMYVTGKMHNRARMLVASFLCKHMQVDWRIGLEWFADCLTDWDPASNAMGWQWVAGSGPDAAPYFRIFNPEGQREKFDPDNIYTRHWLAEGQRSPTQDALGFFNATPNSWDLCADAPYPEPMLDLAQGRAAALAAYEVMKAQNGK